MRRLNFILIVFLLIIFQEIIFSQNNSERTIGKYVLVIHGGAGSTPKDLPDSIQQKYLSSLNEALQIGNNILENGGTSLDAVEKVVRYFEDNPLFNAGKGAVLNSEGKVELDASIMNGKDLSCGAVTGIKHVKHPITLARTIMEKTQHIFFYDEGAEEIAQKNNLEMVDENYFIDSTRYKRWLEQKQKFEQEKKGTVGAVALDKYGNLAAATSTGGLSNKMPGRIGDSPIIGAGNYANNKTCAVSGTGIGEKFIKNLVAYNISALMEYKNFTLKEAAEEVVFNKLEKNDGGIIAVDKNGNYVMMFNTTSMFRGVITSDGLLETKIWE